MSAQIWLLKPHFIDIELYCQSKVFLTLTPPTLLSHNHGMLLCWMKTMWCDWQLSGPLSLHDFVTYTVYFFCVLTQCGKAAILQPIFQDFCLQVCNDSQHSVLTSIPKASMCEGARQRKGKNTIENWSYQWVTEWMNWFMKWGPILCTCNIMVKSWLLW